MCDGSHSNIPRLSGVLCLTSALASRFFGESTLGVRDKMAAEEDNVVDPDDLAEGFLEEGDDVDGDPDDLLAGD